MVSYEFLFRMALGTSILGLFFGIGVSLAGLALGVALAMLRFRRRGDQLGMDAAMTLGLLGVGPLFVIGILYIAELSGLVGA